MFFLSIIVLLMNFLLPLASFPLSERLSFGNSVTIISIRRNCGCCVSVLGDIGASYYGICCCLMQLYGRHTDVWQFCCFSCKYEKPCWVTEITRFQTKSRQVVDVSFDCSFKTVMHCRRTRMTCALILFIQTLALYKSFTYCASVVSCDLSADQNIRSTLTSQLIICL